MNFKLRWPVCDKHVCFLHIQLIGTKVWLPNMHNVPRSQSLDTVPIWIVELYLPQDNIVCIHSWNESKRSNVLDVCHKLWSILWSYVQVCWLTIEYQVYQSAPRKDSLDSLRTYMWQLPNRFQFFLHWIDGHQDMELVPYNVVEWSCLPIHNNVPHISLHDLPYRKIT